MLSIDVSWLIVGNLGQGKRWCKFTSNAVYTGMCDTRESLCVCVCVLTSLSSCSLSRCLGGACLAHTRQPWCQEKTPQATPPDQRVCVNEHLLHSHVRI